MMFGKIEKNDYEDNTHCCICDKEIKKGDTLHCHHGHATGVFIGASCRVCNLQLRQEKKYYTLPVVFHNFKSYDAHHILQYVKPYHGKINTIANTMKKCVSLTIGGLAFKDSF